MLCARDIINGLVAQLQDEMKFWRGVVFPELTRKAGKEGLEGAMTLVNDYWVLQFVG